MLKKIIKSTFKVVVSSAFNLKWMQSHAYLFLAFLTLNVSNVFAYELIPNPNPAGNVITVTTPDAEVTTETYLNEGAISVESAGVLTNYADNITTGAGSAVTIQLGGKLVNAIGVELKGVFTIDEFGSLTNYAVIDNFSRFKNSASYLNAVGSTFYNYTGATLTNTKGLSQSGTVVNSADFENTVSEDGVGANLVNSGVWTNETGSTFINKGKVDNFGTITNSGLISNIYAALSSTSTTARVNNYNIVNNAADGVISNEYIWFNRSGDSSSSTINNNGVFTNALSGRGMSNEANSVINNLTGAVFNNVNSLNNSGVINNTGTFNNNNSLNNKIGSTFNNNNSLVNTATIKNSGTFNVSSSVSGTGTYTQIDGSTIVNSTLGATSIDIQEGLLTGSGNLVGPVTVAALSSVNPGNTLGVLTVDGDLTFTGTLNTELGGIAPTTKYDLLSVTGSVTLGGTLNVSFVDSGSGLFNAVLGNSFDILTAENITGEFTSLTLQALDSGLTWDVVYIADAIGTLDVVRLSVIVAPVIDSDGDGVSDDVDNCSNTPTGEAVDANGCSLTQLDTDNDGVNNAVDQCPNTPVGEAVDANGCSATQLDDDNDTVNNAVDQCPNTPTGEAVDANGCSLTQLDTDNDGVNNAVDQCPNTPTGEAVDANGCSATQLDDDNDTVNNALDQCPTTPTGEAVDTNGCSATQLDSDNDGVSNDIDQCSNTPTGETVEVNGCSASQLDSGIFQLSATSYNVDENGDSVTITATRMGGSSGTINVNYATSDGTATATLDYASTIGLLTFVDGDTTSKSFNIPINDDTTYEGNENFTISLISVSGTASLGLNNNAIITIVENDPVPPAGILQFNSVNYNVDEDIIGGILSITVTRTSGSYGDISVDYGTLNGTANAATDFIAVIGTLFFVDGDTSTKVFTIPIINDNVFEGDETFTVNLTGNTGGSSLGVNHNAQVTIIEDDPIPAAGSVQFEFDNYNVDENVVNGSVSVTVTRIDGSAGEISIDYATIDGITTTKNIDYAPANGTLNFADGETSSNIIININDNNIYEGNKTFSINLSNPLGGISLGLPKTAQITIIEDETKPIAGTLEFSGSNYPITEDAIMLRVTVNRVGGSYSEVSVKYTSSDLTATDGFDYAAVTGTLIFSDKEISQTFDIQLLDDTLYEGDEIFNLTLSSATNGAMLGILKQATVTIQENDPKPDVGTLQFSSNNYSIVEGSNPNIELSVVRTGSNVGSISIDYSTFDGTAINDEDYISNNGKLQFLDGETTKTINIPIINDDVFELTESFSINLSNASNDALLNSSSSATITIENDDRRPPVPPPAPPPSTPPSTPPNFGSGHCFIATAAYGSYLSSEVRVLRMFRDEYLLTSYLGRKFVEYYYRTSPPVAKYISQHEILRAVTRVLLTPMVFIVKYPSFVVMLILLLICIKLYLLIFVSGKNKY